MKRLFFSLISLLALKVSLYAAYNSDKTLYYNGHYKKKSYDKNCDTYGGIETDPHAAGKNMHHDKKKYQYEYSEEYKKSYKKKDYYKK
ncbi:MAG: hypothetical protein JXQ67_05805 [Campylobacterales bacterium]|nr:hypothetical protein [Campylobacterales bacterium]